MTDKERIIAEIERLKLCTMDEYMKFYCEEAEIEYNTLCRVVNLIKSMQEEPVSEGFAFKAIPRLLEMIEPTDRAKAYIAKLADTLDVEGYSTDAKIVRESLKIMNGEKVPMATMQEEPVSSIWHDASEKSNEAEDVVVINPSDNTGEVLTGCIKVYQGRIWAYTSVLLNLDNPCKIGKNLQEYPVSEDLEGAAITAADEDMQGRQIMEESNEKRQLYSRIFRRGFKAGTNWQKAKDQSTIELAEDHAMLAGMEKMKEQMMKDAIDVEVKVDAVGYPYIPQMELYDYDKDVPLAKMGDKYKVVLIKED